MITAQVDRGDGPAYVDLDVAIGEYLDLLAWLGEHTQNPDFDVLAEMLSPAEPVDEGLVLDVLEMARRLGELDQMPAVLFRLIDSVETTLADDSAYYTESEAPIDDGNQEQGPGQGQGQAAAVAPEGRPGQGPGLGRPAAGPGRQEQAAAVAAKGQGPQGQGAGEGSKGTKGSKGQSQGQGQSQARQVATLVQKGA